MSVAPFPKIVEPLKMAEQRIDLQGKIALNKLHRLRDLLLDDAGEVSVVLRFGKDEQGIRTILGSLQTEVMMQCQRCLQPVLEKIEAEIKLGLVFNEDGVKNLPSYYDPLLLSSAEVALWQMVEEELILNLPIAAKHPLGECSIELRYGDEAALDAPATPNPFQVLAQLKDK